MSLIELLVVLVILVVGIFSVVRIFPQGFRYLARARNQTQANRLAQAEVERWKANAANLPDGVEAEDPETGEITTEYNPNDMSTAPSGDPEWSNVNRVRMVRGETTVIPAPTLLPYGTGGSMAFSIYNLKFAPIARHGNDPDHFVLIYGDTMRRHNVTEYSSNRRDEVLDDLGQQEYAVDYDSGTLYFAASYRDRAYRVEYNWYDGSRLRNAVQIVNVPSGASFPNPLPEEPAAIKLANKPDPYSDRVARKFDYVEPGQFDRRDPYQFTLLSTYNAMTFAPTIGFNPVGANRSERTNLGARPLTAHIDYEVLDWHVIHEDRTVPSSSSLASDAYTVRLSLPGVKVAGRSYPGMENVGTLTRTARMVRYTGLTEGMDGYSVVALDLTDNTLMLDNRAGGGPSPGALQVDYTTGTVTIPKTVMKYTPFGQSFTQDIGGHDIRIFYQAVGDWGVQVTKPYSNYQRIDVSANNAGWRSIPYNYFAAYAVAPGDSIGDLGYTNATGRWAAVFVFPRKDAGHAISVSFLWTDVDGETHAVTGAERQLPEFASLNQSYPFIAVPFAPNNRFDPGKGPDPWNNPNYTFVQGASLKVRVVWREQPNRWQMRDIETYINRK